MTTVLVVPRAQSIDTREAFEIVSEVAPAYIDYVTSDLAAFLQAVRQYPHGSTDQAISAA